MACDFYFVSILTSCNKEFALSLNVNSLASYFYKAQTLKLLECKKSGAWSGKLLIDNGAYSFWKRGGELDINEYINFLNENNDYIDYAIALDKIPGTYGVPNKYSDVIDSANATYDNFIYMREHMLDKSKLLPVFHQDESFDYLYKYLSMEDVNYICIAPHGMGDKYKWYADCFAIIKKLRPDIKVHCLGATLTATMKQFPFTSMDASTWVFACMSGCVITSIGRVYVGSVDAINELSKYPIMEEIQEVCDIIGIDDIYKLSTELQARQMYTIYELFRGALSADTGTIELQTQLTLL